MEKRVAGVDVEHGEIAAEPVVVERMLASALDRPRLGNAPNTCRSSLRRVMHVRRVFPSTRRHYTHSIMPCS